MTDINDLKTRGFAIAFYSGKSSDRWIRIKQWLTKMWTRGKYSHCEIIYFTDEGPYWYGATTYNPGGIAKRQLTYKKENWDIYRLELKGISRPGLLLFLESKIGYPYDWPGIYLSQIFPFLIHRKDKYFCSEYIAEALGYPSPQSFSPVSLKKRLVKDDVIFEQS
jgi:hypothetical protein